MTSAHRLADLAAPLVVALLVGVTGVEASEAAASPVAERAGQAEGEAKRDLTVHARRYEFTPSRLEVQQGDLVKIVLQSEDIAHSFTIDAYRISRRVGPGGSTVFEFRADKAGTFPIYCNLSAEDGCRDMTGELVVRPRR